MSITYKTTLENITPDMISEFCVGWNKPLSGEELYKVLSNSSFFAAAVDDDRVVGFINALSDCVRFVFIPMIEVLPEYKGKGIGTKLFNIILEFFEDIGNIDLICDEDMKSFYKRFGMAEYTAMILRK